MKAAVPPLLIGLAFTFWGWHQQMLILSITLGVVFEAARLVPLRLDINQDRFKALVNLVIILSIVFLTYLYFSQSNKRVWIMPFLIWMPVLMTPILFAQYYSERGRIPTQSLFTLLRGRLNAGKDKDRDIDFSYVMLPILVISASISDDDSMLYFPGAALLYFWALYPERNRRFALVHWLCMGLIVSLIGFWGRYSIPYMESFIIDIESKLFYNHATYKSSDPALTRTQIGYVGRLKQSNRIVMKVAADASLLLINAVYDVYSSPNWNVSDKRFKLVMSEAKKDEPDKQRWTLAPSAPSTATHVLTVETTHTDDEATLAHPAGSTAINGLIARRVHVNGLGTLKVEREAGYLLYSIRYGSGTESTSMPGEADVVVTDKEKAAIDRFIDRYKLRGLNAGQLLYRLPLIFQSDYRYSLVNKDVVSGASALESFLMVTKSGHCEYYATATTLVLRALNVPARYVTGYLVSERSGKGQFVVRQRHAHAWSVAWHNGRWVDIDSTPATWLDYEEKESSFLQPFGDVFDHALFIVRKWLQEGGVKQSQHVVYAGFGVVLVYLLVRNRSLFALTMRVKRPLKGGVRRQGVDRAMSPFKELEGMIAQRAFPRQPWESILEWLERIRQSGQVVVPGEDLAKLVRLHYRLRFYPDLDSSKVLEELNKGVEEEKERMGNSAS
ncbi:transglutaminase-like enzyme, predicted cysteine protease [Candidatus Magnetobacterium bavaricum]|uniref:Transglutaminase-like enzyme, predicted cysteine protease n=1 Tax=Candidatus Magnetobacterium bavaricum TaxID=29290 RepID=A0A0F3GI45_9BACT|nr:transglutaminase-like enzyme, predicted cysteine protease [Candidatus Magnetobacterium bavaricum]